MIFQHSTAGPDGSPTDIQVLRKIHASREEAHVQDEDNLFDCCWCASPTDVEDRGVTNGRLPSKEEMADAFWKILDAPTQPNDPLHFAVEALIPLQQVTKWASKSDVADEDDMTEFLSQVEKVRGVGIILTFISKNIKNEVAVMCAVRALHALMVEPDREWDSTKDSPLTRARNSLIKDFTRENGMEMLTHAFDQHALTTTPKTKDGTESFSVMELRTKTMDILIVALPFSPPKAAVHVLRCLCSQTPKMIGLLKEKDKQANQTLLQKTIRCLVRAVEVDGTTEKLNMEDKASAVNVSSQIAKAYPRNEQIASYARVLWSWAAHA